MKLEEKVLLMHFTLGMLKIVLCPEVKKDEPRNNEEPVS